MSEQGITFTPGSVDDLPDVMEFGPASFVLTAYGRASVGTYRQESGTSIYFRDPDGARLELIADPLGEMYGTKVR